MDSTQLLITARKTYLKELLRILLERTVPRREGVIKIFTLKDVLIASETLFNFSIFVKDNHRRYVIILFYSIVLPSVSSSILSVSSVVVSPSVKFNRQEMCHQSKSEDNSFKLNLLEKHGLDSVSLHPGGLHPTSGK